MTLDTDARITGLASPRVHNIGLGYFNTDTVASPIDGVYGLNAKYAYNTVDRLISANRSGDAQTFGWEAFNRLRWVWNNGTLIGSSAPRARSGRSLFVSPGRTHDRACPPSRAPPHVPPLR